MTVSATGALDRLQRQIGYLFKQVDLLLLALTHRSHAGKNNERLEFLGDSILNMVIAERLFQQFPKAREGQLSRLRAQLVKGNTLALLAREFKLGDYLRLGSGELKSGGFRRDSILADALESLIAAIYLDAGFHVARESILRWFTDRLDALTLENTPKDAKTRLQEYLQSQQAALPQYEVTAVEGDAHAQVFSVQCSVALLQQQTCGRGVSRRIAEQQAAKAALIQLGVETETTPAAEDEPPRIDR